MPSVALSARWFPLRFAMKKRFSTAMCSTRRSVNTDLRRLEDSEARALIKSVTWYHRFQLRPGLVTPGVEEFDAGPICDSMGIPHDLTNKRALDIGSWDGPLAFEMERRGAEVIALDIQDPNRVGFAVARRILQSRVEHIRASVYELDQLGLGQFDHIAFRGIYYHLKAPFWRSSRSPRHSRTAAGSTSKEKRRSTTSRTLTVSGCKSTLRPWRVYAYRYHFHTRIITRARVTGLFPTFRAWRVG